MAKLFALIAVAVAVYLLVRHWRPPKSDRKPPVAAPVKMLACDHCGVFVPEPDAVRAGDRAYCSETHRRLAHSEDD